MANRVTVISSVTQSEEVNKDLDKRRIVHSVENR